MCDMLELLNIDLSCPKCGQTMYVNYHGDGVCETCDKTFMFNYNWIDRGF